MKALRIAALAALLLPAGLEAQDRRPVVARLLKAEEKKGKWLLTFATPYRPGSRLKIQSAQPRTSAIFSVPPDQKDVIALMKVTLEIGNRLRWRPGVDVVANGRGEVAFELPASDGGIARFKLTYDPERQEGKDPRHPSRVETEHAFPLAQAGWARRALVDDPAKALEFAERFRVALRKAIQEDKTTPLEEAMAALIDQAAERSEGSRPPGLYGLMTDLSAFLHSTTGDAEGDAHFNPAIVDVKFKPVPMACGRESLALALATALEVLAELQRNAILDPALRTGPTLRALLDFSRELETAVGEIGRFESTGRFKARATSLGAAAPFAELRRFAELLENGGSVDLKSLDACRAAMEKVLRSVLKGSEWPLD